MHVIICSMQKDSPTSYDWNCQGIRRRQSSKTANIWHVLRTLKVHLELQLSIKNENRETNFQCSMLSAIKVIWCKVFVNVLVFFLLIRLKVNFPPPLTPPSPPPPPLTRKKSSDASAQHREILLTACNYNVNTLKAWSKMFHMFHMCKNKIKCCNKTASEIFAES